MNLKKIRQFLTAFIIAIGLVSGTVTAASATTGGGTGGGGSTGQQSGFYWASVSSSSAGSAYEQFLSKSRWSRATAEREVAARVGSIQVCQNSDVIWFLMGPSVWAYNFQGYPTWLTHWMFQGSIQSPRVLAGPAPTGSQYQNFIDWDNGVGGMRRDNSGGWNDYGYTIVCSYATYRPPITRNTTEVTVAPPTTKTASYTEPYSWTTELTRQPITGGPAGKKDPIGVDNLHDQSLVTVKTNFGSFWDSVNTSNAMTPQQLNDGAAAALKKDETLGHGVASLDAANKEGIAEGGVLNVKEQTKYATVTTSETSTVTTTRNCTYTRTWNSYWAAYNAETSSCNSSSSTNIARTSSKVAGTQQNTGFWQMLAVHCNLAEFDALLKSDSSLKQITTPDTSNAISGSVITKNYGQQPAKLDFGDSTNPNAAKAKTGNLAFFDKECAFDCKPNAIGSDATASNGASTNVGGAGAIENSDKIKSNVFEFFRDNGAKKISIDTWYPEDKDGVTYEGEAPITTTITRDVAGTPSLDGSSGGQFTMKSTEGNTTLFKGTSTDVSNQKNWNSSTFSGPTATILKGLHRDFTVQSTWASDAGKPQVFNFKWEYTPKVTTTVPVSEIGFGSASAQNVGKTGDVTTQIEGKCYNFFGTAPADAPDMTSQLGTNTGTGTTNNLDNKLLTDAAAKLTTNFVRSTTE